MSETRQINSIANYMEFIGSLPQTVLGNASSYDSSFVFRGQSSVSYELLPSIARTNWHAHPRVNAEPPVPDALHREADIIESVCQALPGIFNGNMQPVDLLACLQHYGVPTRLLDVTSNALAALYFACESGKSDGEVLIFRRRISDRRDYPVCQAIADTWRLSAASRLLTDFASLAISRPYFDYQRNAALRLYPEEDKQALWFEECCAETMFVRGTRYLDRQAAQAGEYILFPNVIEKSGKLLAFGEQIAPLDKDGPVIAGRCVIPVVEKGSLLAGLRRLGITRAALFPDDIGAVCSDAVNEILQRG